MKGIRLSICILIDVLCLGIPITAHAAIDNASLVGAWLFDEDAGEVARDSSENQNDAKFEGAPKSVTGQFGKALKFNGSTDYVAAPDSASLDINGDQLSILAWINGEGWPAANHIVRKIADVGTGHIYVLRVHPETVRLILNTNGADTTIDGQTPLPTNRWIHVAIVYDGKEARIYVDGELDNSGAVSGELSQSDNEMRIGRGEPAGYFVGMIDEVAIFSSALTDNHIQSIMNAGLRQEVLAVMPLEKLTTMWARVKMSH